MVQTGRTWSGRERNCCFLNLGSGEFANLSSASGIDFPDDGRGIATCDWDLDGDLDVWLSNRTGPMLRFLRNDAPGDHHWLAVGLEGRTGNRDAVGARLEVHLDGAEVPLLRTLRAGDAFLSQSSKWVHFGLGDADRIAKLVVRWPGGAVEAYPDLPVDRRFRIVEGTGVAEPWSPGIGEGDVVALAPSTVAASPTDDRVALFSPTGVPVPRLPWEAFDGTARAVRTGTLREAAAPVVVNLWATWCAPCLEELRAWSARADDFQEAGVEVVVLSVDDLGDGDGDGDGGRGGAAKAAEMIARLGVPFTSGMATAAVPDKIQMLNDLILDFRRPLPVPTTILIDHYGRLAGLYKGPVEVDRLLEDVRNLPLDNDEKRDLSLPFPGRWIAPVRQLQFFPLALQLAGAGYHDDAEKLLADHHDMLMSQPGAPRLLVLLGQGAETRGDYRRALEWFARAVRLNQRFTRGVDAYARLLAACPDDHLRRPAEAVDIAERIAQRTEYRDPLVLDTLAIAYAANGSFSSAKLYAEKAIGLAGEQDQEALVAEIRGRLEQFDRGEPWRLVPPPASGSPPPADDGP